MSAGHRLASSILVWQATATAGPRDALVTPLDASLGQA